MGKIFVVTEVERTPNSYKISGKFTHLNVNFKKEVEVTRFGVTKLIMVGIETTSKINPGEYDIICSIAGYIATENVLRDEW